MKKILVLQGHTDKNSFVFSLAKSFETAYEDRFSIETVDLSKINFDPVLKNGYKEELPLEECLIDAQKKILQSDILVIFYPTWWGTMPAKLKGFFDRVFLPGFAFKYIEGENLPKKLLKGKIAYLVTTMDTPPFFYRFFQGNLGVKLLEKLILGFSGIKVKKKVLIGPVAKMDSKKREKWLNNMSSLLK